MSNGYKLSTRISDCRKAGFRDEGGIPLPEQKSECGNLLRRGMFIDFVKFQTVYPALEPCCRKESSRCPDFLDEKQGYRSDPVQHVLSKDAGWRIISQRGGYQI